MGGGGSGKRVKWENLSMEDFFMGKGILHEGVPDFLALF